MNEIDKMVTRFAAQILALEQQYMKDQQKIANLERAVKDYELFCEANLAEPVPEKAA